RYGTLSLEQIIDLAKKSGLQYLVLADINNSTGILDFVNLCQKNNINPVAGIEFRNDNDYLYTGIAKNNEGFMELNDFLSEHNLENKKLPATPPELNNVFFIFPFGKKKKIELTDNEYIAIKPFEIGKIFNSEFQNDQSKLVIYYPVTFANPANFELHKHLRAIDNNLLLSQLKPFHLAHNNEVMVPFDKLISFYKDYPQIVNNTEKLISDCSFQFDFKEVKNKKTFTGNHAEDRLLLEKLAFDGLVYRYGKNNINAEKRVKHELEIICKLGFAAYFLIAWDVIRYSMSNGIYHVGRGSGANSLVAYCLKITDVDPIELDLYFERFINPKRTSPPDFDIDYSWKDRDQVQDYIFKRFGKKHTALLGAMSTFAGKSIYRELGKVYGLPKEEMDAFIDNPLAERNNNEITRKIIDIGNEMFDFPNIRSIHAGGILISEKPITYYTALDLPPKGYPTTQWDMYVAEDIGFEKLDILSQRGIGHINECVEIVQENRGTRIDVHQVKKFKQDKQVKYQLKIGETIGCFYIESPAMRGLLKKLRCDNYISLVAASSIIRPGVAQSGMMREYIHRFHHPDSFTYLHPVMEEQLKETYGVMVYQEDVLKVCHHFAGLDLADADVLRRVMSGKPRFKNEFDLIVDTFFRNCNKRGYPPELTKEVWRQIASFAGYSFSKAHSASYAVESFQSLYLKSHFPYEFMVAVINNFGGFYRTWVYFNEARRCGANVCLPCVNNSKYKTTIIGKDIYIGFVHVSNLENKTGQQIEQERTQNGPFSDLKDFINRVAISLEQLIILIRIGAFRFTGKSKAHLLWDAHFLLGHNKKAVSCKKLFDTPRKECVLPELETSKVEDAYDEIEYLDFPVTLTHFDLLKTKFRGEIFAHDLMNNLGKKVRMVGHLVTLKYVWTSKKEIMHFGCFFDVKNEFFDTVHFPDSLKKYPFKGGGVYLILGKVVQEFGHPSIEVEKMAKLPIINDP
ncbi:MAG: DNA polymerase III subunit alpha, partial [Bacteroidales bacterium]|nr:DNA polymerase III subunit alpha [Bacteroidales bacterium]